ncbi:MAG: pantoate kinase [Promethearchaeota archaeon]
MKKGKIVVKVPHRISGFFEIVDQVSQEPEKIGSRGAGFNINAIGTTEIRVQELEKNQESKCIIKINNEELNQKAETSYFIFNSIRHLIKNPVEIHVNHSFELPVGCGYGASGSGALGMIYGLNEILKLNLDQKEKGRIAHVAEVINKTGLGTVCGQLAGGLCMLKEPGYPCVQEMIQIPRDIEVICGSFGMIHTKSILTDPVLNVKIKEAGKNALKKLIQAPSIETFAKVSKEFVEETGILDILHLIKTKELMNRLNKIKIIGASMNQLGRSIYAICKKKDSSIVNEVFETYKPEITLIKTSINHKGLQIIKTE